MSKEISLVLSERRAALALMSEFKGGIEVMAALLDDAKKLSIKEDEWTAANLVKTPTKTADGQDGESWVWKDEGSEKSLELENATCEYVAQKIKAKSDAGEFTLADSAILSLANKLK